MATTRSLTLPSVLLVRLLRAETACPFYRRLLWSLLLRATASLPDVVAFTDAMLGREQAVSVFRGERRVLVRPVPREPGCLLLAVLGTLVATWRGKIDLDAAGSDDRLIGNRWTVCFHTYGRRRSGVCGACSIN